MNADEIVQILQKANEAIETLQGAYEVMSALADVRKEEIESLQAQLAASQRRERATVEDINAVRMCRTCKHFLREFGMGGIECKIPCVTIRHENFEGRGPQEAGKGE